MSPCEKAERQSALYGPEGIPFGKDRSQPCIMGSCAFYGRMLKKIMNDFDIIKKSSSSCAFISDRLSSAWIRSVGFYSRKQCCFPVYKRIFARVEGT